MFMVSTHSRHWSRHRYYIVKWQSHTLHRVAEAHSCWHSCYGFMQMLWSMSMMHRSWWKRFVLQLVFTVLHCTVFCVFKCTSSARIKIFNSIVLNIALCFASSCAELWTILRHVLHNMLMHSIASYENKRIWVNQKLNKLRQWVVVNEGFVIVCRWVWAGTTRQNAWRCRPVVPQSAVHSRRLFVVQQGGRADDEMSAVTDPG